MISACSISSSLMLGVRLSQGGASYLNPYPIMDAGFCESVGIDNSTGLLNCTQVDFDALLLGGCWCHTCLPENPCMYGGKCHNWKNVGYTCACTSEYDGDHCHHLKDAADGNEVARLGGDFPFYIMPTPALPPPRPSSPSPASPISPALPAAPVSLQSVLSSTAIALICSLVAAVLIVVAAMLLFYVKRRARLIGSSSKICKARISTTGSSAGGASPDVAADTESNVETKFTL